MLTKSVNFGLSVHFSQIKRSEFFCVLFNFLLFEKMVQRNCIKFCVKNEIKCRRTFEMLIVEFGEFHCGITGLKKAEKMTMTILVMVAQARQQPMKTLKQGRK